MSYGLPRWRPGLHVYLGMLLHEGAKIRTWVTSYRRMIKKVWNSELIAVPKSGTGDLQVFAAHDHRFQIGTVIVRDWPSTWMSVVNSTSCGWMPGFGSNSILEEHGTVFPMYVTLTLTHGATLTKAPWNWTIQASMEYNIRHIQVHKPWLDVSKRANWVYIRVSVPFNNDVIVKIQKHGQ